jgi:inositol transport system substrate-binding protein
LIGGEHRKGVSNAQSGLGGSGGGIVGAASQTEMKEVAMRKAKLWVVAGLLLCGLGATTLSATGKSERSIVIGVSWQNLANEFVKNIQSGAREKAKELGAKLIEADGAGKAEMQISQIENFIAQKVSAVILHPYDKSGCAAAVDKCIAAKIPIILVTCRTDNMDKANAFVGSNDVVAGEIEMQFIADKLKGEGSIVIIHGPNGHSAEIDRTVGNHNVLKKYPAMKVLAEQTANWDRTQALSLTENWLISGMPFRAIVAQNDEMALGALLAVEGAKKKDKIYIIGIDAIPDALNSVKAGRLDATVFQNGVRQGAGAVDVAVRIVKGEKVPFMNEIPFELVTPDVVSRYLK